MFMYIFKHTLKMMLYTLTQHRTPEWQVIIHYWQFAGMLKSPAFISFKIDEIHVKFQVLTIDQQLAYQQN